MVLMRQYFYSHLKILRQYSLVLINLLVFVTPQWSSAEEILDCNDPAANCNPVKGAQIEAVESTPTLGPISVLKKGEKAPIPTASVIVGTPSE